MLPSKELPCAHSINRSVSHHKNEARRHARSKAAGLSALPCLDKHLDDTWVASVGPNPNFNLAVEFHI